MAKKPTVTTITTGYSSADTLNENFEALREGFDNTLSLDGSTPNAMEADLDLNGNNIIGAAGLLVNGTDYLADVEAAKAAALVAQAAAELAETNAETAETNAGVSETAAGSSATAAATSETNAGASETAASGSATASATSATNSATSASQAAASASAASTSETNAATSETNAATSETNSATSATESETAKIAAEAAKDAALAALDSFDDRYLGAKASDPTLDNDGNALVAGALYYNTTDDVMKVYEGSVWVAAYASLSGALLATNNLSDLTNATTARTNLGLGTAATTASTDYATAAQGALADSALQNITGESIENLSDVASMTPSDGQALVYGSGVWSAADMAGGIAYTRHTANVTMAANEGVIADTSGGAFTVTLPASPATGDTVVITDGGDWATTNLTVGRNGSTIEGDAADMTMDIGGVAVQFTYDGTTWQIYTQLGANSGNVVVEGSSPTFNVVTATSYSGDGSALTGLPAGPKAHHSLSVINAQQAALERFNLTKQGVGNAKVIQGFASDPYTNELFTLHVTDATSNPPVQEKAVINKFEADGRRTQTSYRYTSTPLTTLGHQELDISWDKSGARWFWTGENEAVTNQARYIKRFQIADGAGTDLTVSNVQQFQVFTDAETTGTEDGSASTCISLDGRYLVTEYSGSDTNRVKVFKTATLMNGGAGDYSTQQVYSWTFDLDTGDYPLQSMACDGAYVYIFTGNITTGNTLKVLVYTVKGQFVEEIDDFTVGEAEAQGDGAGTAYELEGAGWIWHGGQPMLACSIASGDSGSRVNRIWVLGAKVSVTAYGDGNKPAFISQGANDLAAPDGETLRLGHYNGATDTFTEGASINTSNQLEFTPVTGTWTAYIYDAASGGNASSTTDTAQYSKIGNMVWINMSFSNVDITGMTSGSNFYIRGHGFTPTESAVFGTPVVSDFELATGDFNVVAEIGTDGNITLREIQDSAVNTIANVSQIDEADIRISGWFKV